MILWRGKVKGQGEYVKSLQPRQVQTSTRLNYLSQVVESSSTTSMFKLQVVHGIRAGLGFI